MADYLVTDTELTSVADAIRTRGGTSASLAFPSGFVTAINNIPSGVTPTGTVTQDQDGYIILPTEGGGSGASPIMLLDAITVSEQVRALNIDITPYSSYDMILIFADITLTASDWLYVVKNGSSASGGSYSENVSRLKGLLYVRGTTACGRTGWTDAVTYYGGMSSGNSTVTNLYVYTYNSSKFITAGSKFWVYGGTYADILQ